MVRALIAILLLAAVGWAAWLIAYQAASDTHGGIPPPPFVSQRISAG